MMRKIRVLLVEDSPTDAELVLRELRRSGFTTTHSRVESATDLEAALSREEWDIILSDFEMPSFDGLSALDLVRKSELDVPFIIVSGAVGEELAVRAMKKGLNDLVLKDNLARLPGAVQRELREAENRREARVVAASLEVQNRRFRSNFNSSSVSQWEVDFTGVVAWLEDHGFSDVDRLDRYLSRHPAGLREAARAGRILDVNATTLSLLEVRDKGALLGSIDRVLDMGFEDAWVTTLRALAGHGGRVESEATVRSATGRELRLLVSLHLPDRRDDLANVVVTTVDVTERWQMESQMRAAQRMEAVGRLAGGVAHDFNNVITVIQSYARFLQDQFRPQDPAREDVDVIMDAAARAAKLTNQLLAFSRRQVQRLEVVDLNQIIKELDRMLRRLIGEDVEVRTQLSQGLGLVKVDPSQIDQVAMNLAVNARDAMPDGGKLTIETANVRLDEVYGAAKNVRVPPGDYVMLAVTDTGTGIDMETQLQIFEPFFTTKDVGKGTGLGLSTVYGIVKQSRGYIWVYSEVGKGATFKIYFPRVHTADARSTMRIRLPRMPAGGSETILLVEDERLVRLAARRILEEAGYAVLEASHGGDALLIAETRQEPIHLLLTDLVMPEIGGRRLADRLTPLHPEMRVAYMSGYTDNAIVHHGVLDEGTTYIQKPFTPESLLRTVRGVLDEASGEG